MNKAHNRTEMEGKRYNNWTVLEYDHTKNKITYWKCRCELCKKELIVDGRNIRNGRSKQCAECGREFTRQANIGKKKSEETKKKISEAHKGKKLSQDHVDKLRGFKLSRCDQELANIDSTEASNFRGLRISKKINDIKQKAKSRKKEYKLTKLEAALLITSKCKYCNKESEPYNGIDRVDSSKGYESDNVVPCCFKCNSAKNDMSVEEFKEWIERIHSNINNF